MSEMKSGLKLGFGLMRLPKLEDGSIDVEQVKEMVDLFLEAGGTYFDTAFAYQGSEEAIRKALIERYPRDMPVLPVSRLPTYLRKSLPTLRASSGTCSPSAFSVRSIMDG